MRRPDTIEKLLTFLTGPAPPMSDAKRRFKFPYSACEVLCCEASAFAWHISVCMTQARPA